MDANNLEFLKYVLAPIICALIGWFTNYLAVKMLFHPRVPIKIGPFVLHGIFPKRQKALAANIGELVQRELVSHDDIQNIVNDPTFTDRFNHIAEEYIEIFISEKLHSLHPMIGAFLNDQIKEKLKEMLMEQFSELIPKLIMGASEELENRLDFGDLVRQKIEAFSMEKLEDVLFSIMKSEFKFIELVGGVLGFVIGVAQSAMFYFM